MLVKDRIRCNNVGELIAELSKYDPKTLIETSGADCGGYDVVCHPFAYVVFNDHSGVVHIDPLECDAYIEVKEKLITYEEYAKMFNEKG